MYQKIQSIQKENCNKINQTFLAQVFQHKYIMCLTCMRLKNNMYLPYDLSCLKLNFQRKRREDVAGTMTRL